MSSRFIMPFADVGSGIKPSSGAQLFFFEVDGVTPKDTYSDQLSTPTQNTNPVTSSSNGVFSDIYISGQYKVTLKDKNGSQIFGGAIVDELSTSIQTEQTENLIKGNVKDVLNISDALLETDPRRIFEGASLNVGGKDGGMWDVISDNGVILDYWNRESSVSGLVISKRGIENKGVYLYSAFRGEQNSQQKIFLYSSTDGIDIRAIAGGLPVFSSDIGVIRDPSIILHNDVYYACYTIVDGTGSYLTDTYGVAKSSNLTDWEHVADYDMSGLFPGVQRVWAPEFFVDYDQSVYVVVAIDFNTYLIPHSGDSLEVQGSPINLNLPGETIDAYIIQNSGSYLMFVKNEITKFVEKYESNNLSSGWAITGAGDWAGWGGQLEGHSVVVLKDGSVRIYLDSYSDAKYYYSDAESITSGIWTPKKLISSSGEIRHFSAMAVLDDKTINFMNGSKLASSPGEIIGVGAIKKAEGVTLETDEPFNRAMNAYRCDTEYAVFQARARSGNNGLDVIVDPVAKESRIESHSSTGPKYDSILMNHETGQPSFPVGILPAATFNLTTFVNGWVAGGVQPSYHKNYEGFVKLRGTVQAGTATSGTVIATLPAGYFNPNYAGVFPVADNDTSVGTVGISPTGQIIILSGTNVKLDLAGVSFYIQ